MWPDNETEIDFLNFSSVSDTVAEIIVQANRRPISIGVSGAWGVGKSSMIRMIRSSLASKDSESSNYLFVEFNAWLYQGYDDVRAALLEIIATALQAEAEKRKTGLQKATELLSRVDWLRFAKLGIGTAAATAAGLPPVGLLGEVFRLGSAFAFGTADQRSVDNAGDTIGNLAKETGGLLRPRAVMSPPREIQAIRDLFEQTLIELGVTLVVLIDDLDRCLPETTISTLEAIRLFLFLKSTAFVLAADNDMIKHAVRKHFEGVDDKHVTSYFDKLIQVPIRVPPLGTQEVRAYIMLLFVETSQLESTDKDRIRQSVCKQLATTWQGKRVDRALMQTLGVAYPSDLIARFDAADRLAPLMASASQIEGNPRLIKRFLNALSIRMSIAHAHGIAVDEAVLAKLLLFERCGSPSAFSQLTREVSNGDHGKPSFLSEMEARAASEDKPEFQTPWNDSFAIEWLRIPPLLAGIDLRGALYVSREHAPLATPTDRLSSEGAEVLTALLEHPDMAGSMSARISTLPRPELSFIHDRLLENARQIQEWGVPPILEACIVVARCDPSLGERLAAFIEKRPGQQITPSLIPKILLETWATKVLRTFEHNKDVAPQVKRTIKKELSNGNI